MTIIYSKSPDYVRGEQVSSLSGLGRYVVVEIEKSFYLEVSSLSGLENT
jgi:hypothetical protein